MTTLSKCILLGLMVISTGCTTRVEDQINGNIRMLSLPGGEVVSERELAMVHDNRGRILFMQGDLERAIREFRKATIMSPESPVPHNNLAIASHLQGDVTGARAEYLIAIKLNPRFAEAWNNLGLALFDHGDTRSAVAHWQTAVKLNPRLASAWAGLAIGLFKVGDVDRAVKSYIQAFRLDPRYTDLGYLQHVRRWSPNARKHAGLLLEILKSENHVNYQKELKI